jgi:methylmalonyl-CoA mutase
MSGPADDLLDGAGFPVGTPADWRARVANVLRRRGEAAGPEPDEALIHTTYDGIRIRPLYTGADAGAPPAGPVGRAAGLWDVRTLLADADAARVNAAALAELEHGVTSLWLRLGEGGLGVPELGAALHAVPLGDVPVALDAGGQATAAASELLVLAARQGVEPSGTLGADPIGHGARTGAPADLQMLAELADVVADRPELAAATVDGTVYHDAGASDGQELAIATAVGVAYLRALTGAGLGLERALAAIEFRFAVTDDQFAGIAKLRAARRIWARVGELCGCARPVVQRQHTVTSAAMLTRRDPWVNLPRATIACLAAAVGGADVITVLPFDHAIGQPDGFARRIARNTSAILREEADIARVVDAAGGSWFAESLSAALAGRAWELFTEIERDGGAVRALESGHVAQLVGAVRERRAADIARRLAPITGVSEFAHLDEEPLRRAAAAPEPPGGLPRARYAEPFEAIRDRAEASGSRPRVFLAALGEFAGHADAASFATNLFRSGGVETVSAAGASDELVAAWQHSATPVACICAPAEHPGVAAEAAALKAAGVRLLWLVGEPGTRPGADFAAGVDGYLHLGCDAVDALTRTLDAIGACR